ncbi:hypothetical protein HAZT_HAZT009858 [Hyalella azteca]|uniref:Cadherin domain-containing protein n=1 Tax=Hyalella azteca TaxID=294128 RepID=A0A6A0GSL8_HYAAZ|nr:hypothetical protein HAZT_HAZT009858 [Hyalella azteca]
MGTDAWENKYRVGEATVIVRILDVNDNAPSFEKVQQSVRISEDAPLGTVVAKVPAFDLDENLFMSRTQNRNGLVRYSLAGRRGSSPHFGIDHTGTIRTIGLVDREAISKHSLVVHATDHGVPPRQSSATVTVSGETVSGTTVSSKTVSGETSSATVTVSGMTASGKTVSSKTVSGKTVSGKTVSGMTVSGMAVNGMTVSGITVSGKSISDRTVSGLTVSGMTLIGMTVSDKTVNGRTVEIDDVNDNAPIFTGPTYVNVHRNNIDGFTSYFNLTDPDDWSVGHGPPFSAQLDPRAPSIIRKAVSVAYKRDSAGGVGSIKIKRRLDMDAPASFVVPVLTADGGRPAMTGTVSLTIAVVSEDSPIAARDVTLVALNSEMEIGQAIPLGSVSSKESGKAEYSWSRSHKYFVLDKRSGNLFAEASTPSGSYGLSIAIYEPPAPDVQASLNVAVGRQARHQALHSTPVDVAAKPEALIDTTQIEEHLGLSILGSGMSRAEEQSLNDQRQEGAATRAPYAHAMRNKRVNGKLVDCNENTCLNGGRCLPSAPGFNVEKQGNRRVGLVLQLTEGKPLFRLSLNSATVDVSINTSLADLRWHRVDIFWRNKPLENTTEEDRGPGLEEDRGPGLEEDHGPGPSKQFYCRNAVHAQDLTGQLNTRGAPLQLGAMDASSSDALHENNGDKQSYFKGCLRNIRLNGEVGNYTVSS